MHSFMWAERLKDQEAAAGAKAVGDQYTAAMQAEPAVSLSQVFETRQGAFIANFFQETCMHDPAEGIVLFLQDLLVTLC